MEDNLTKLKIGLVRPNYPAHIISPPLGLGYLSSSLKKASYKTVLIDGLCYNLKNEEIGHHLGNCPIVGISILSDYFPEAKKLIALLKKQGKTVILGGPHPWAMPRQSLEDTGADFVLMGEGEENLPKLLNALAKGESMAQIPALAYKNKGIIINPMGDFIEDLDSLPFPDWVELKPQKYPPAPHGALTKGKVPTPIITSRGCPHNCHFCASPFLWQRKIRRRSKENIILEIKYLMQNFQVDEIQIEDDNFTGDPIMAQAICQEISAQNLNIHISFPNGLRAETLKLPLLKKMKKAGTYFFMLGIESANKSTLEKINKNIVLDDFSRAISNAHKAGIEVGAFFIFGFPEDTRKTILNSIKYAIKRRLDRADFQLLDILPGSYFWEKYHKSQDVNEKKRSFLSIKWHPGTISPWELKFWLAGAFVLFWARPRKFGWIIKSIRFENLPFLFNRAWDYGIISLPLAWCKTVIKPPRKRK